MKETNLTVHTIVQNEEQWIWYVLTSVIDYVDEILVYDTGSTDKTIEIIGSIRSPKIKLTQKGPLTPVELVALRNEQIKKTKTDWFMLLDGDEVWSQSTMQELVKTITKASQRLTAIAIKTIVPVGDLYHYQPKSAGRYEILGHQGHLNIRGYKIKKGYKWQGEYPLEVYTDRDGVPIQQKKEEVAILKNSYWHLTHLRRSTVDNHGKRKLEIGERKDIEIPEVFFQTRPYFAPSPWAHFTAGERVKAVLITPLLRIKRSFLWAL